VGSDGRFHCPCGITLTPSDLALGRDERWCITPAGQLAYITTPVVALRRYREARAVMDDKGVWGRDLEAAHAEYRRALAELDAARSMGLPLPEDTPAAIGRVYFAAVIDPDGSFGGGNAHALGWDCSAVPEPPWPRVAPGRGMAGDGRPPMHAHLPGVVPRCAGPAHGPGAGR
jgi:hypothetical protein